RPHRVCGRHVGRPVRARATRPARTEHVPPRRRHALADDGEARRRRSALRTRRRSAHAARTHGEISNGEKRMTAARSILVLLACGIASTHAAITADFPTLPNDSWYRVEIIVFERVADPPPSEEVLVLHGRRVLPRDVVAFDDDASRAAAYPLDADT